MTLTYEALLSIILKEQFFGIYHEVYEDISKWIMVEVLKRPLN